MSFPSHTEYKDTIWNAVRELDPDNLFNFYDAELGENEPPLWYISIPNRRQRYFGQRYSHIYTPLYIDIKNKNKYSSKTSRTIQDLNMHFIYHWVTAFIHLSSYDQIKAAILNKETCPSLATTLAVNKFITDNQLTEKEIKNLLKGSYWRWTVKNNYYFQKTFYNWDRDSACLDIFVAINCPTPNYPFTDFIRNTLAESVEYQHRCEEEDREEARLRAERENEPKLAPHSTKATNFFKFKPSITKQHNTFLGIELELEGFSAQEFKTLNVLNSHAIFKSDGSLNNGVEICTAPATLDIHTKEFTTFFEHLEKNNSNLRAESTCGLHIHIDKRKLSQLHIATLYLFINNDNNQTNISLLAGRKPNNYCELHKITYDYFTDKTAQKNKYRQVNLVPTETIELRLFASTTNKNDFFKRLEFAQALVDYTRPGETNLPIKEVPKWDNFFNYLKTKTKLYPHLVKHFYPTKERKIHATI